MTSRAPWTARVALLGPAISANTSVVLDFADVCGNTFALTRDGLRRLVSTGPGLATWEPVTLPVGPTSFPVGKLHVAGPELIVWLEQQVFSVQVPCAQ